MAIVAGWDNIAGAFTPLKTSAGITALNNSGFDANDYISTGADCGINYYKTLRNTGVGSPNGATAILNAGAITTTQQSGWGRFASHQGVFAMAGNGFPNILVGCAGTCLQGFMYSYSYYAQAASKRYVREAAMLRLAPSTGAGVIKLCQYGSVIASGDDYQGTTSPGTGNLTVCGSTNSTAAGDQLRMFWYGPGVTAADYALIYNRGNTLCNSLGFGSSTNSFHIMGDSISTTYGGAEWMATLKAKPGWDGRWMNYSLSGGSFGSMASANTMANKYSGLYFPYRPDATVWTKGVIFILCGTNDLGFGTSGSTLLTNTIALATTARADGFKVVVMKILPRDDTNWNSTKETERGVYNNGLTTNASQFNQVIDISQATGMSDPTNTTYWLSDKLHPNATGSASMGDYLYSQINLASL